ncbi:S1/P1 nuclease [Chroococcidiopsis sp. CCNUC1]|uniref:S1/P1 nuclease n=1 Tax=Chroococcidiopsis sp. CCNUC1 TaxID=2653189 RepID=UPI002020DF80|nr:S1/P1 nuclease [Chroococcidiopsis sp. CCNUC1]URD53539.1 S1/P1 nuclease [Chroococcidiopsis sp. CCNUC1]
MSVILTLVISFLLLLPSPAYAWNRSGHMVTGAIAYSELQQNDPQALANAIDLLREHPEYNSRWSSQLSQNTDSTLNSDQILFMLAARWSDDIRGNDNFDRPRWHYINLPYRPEGQPASVSVREPDPDNIINAFQENLALVRSGNSGSERAVALCWLFHLTGDVHQPLHTSTLFTTEYPQGDRGGTRFYIRARESSSPISLHRFWDDLILGSENARTVRNRATGLRLNQNYSRDALSELSERQFDNWAESESFELARVVAYRNGNLAGSPDEENAPVLPSDYASSAQAVGERRAVLAGYRLSDLLQQVF